ncbi:methyltransferase domain-containing protein [Ottowia sp.]|uniref:methyltransferase domain-containing protein n=1 Tax=Ottowia sp. TaxID=1898956 RepID=UPI002B698059|nr:methyltransferase domain-containing protein [Ottowia sp.]HNR84115.1 methyltransferase domain-containing protein [Ottowia sp.]
MAAPSPALHVYERDIDASERTSLSVLTRHIPAGARVLDLGCGSGAIGRFLAARDGAGAGPIDGLTLSHDEARRAAPHYRRVEVADLESCDLPARFAPGSYDVVVCADVLEHLRQPQRVMDQCRRLLAADGRALLSVPNAGYVGLVAELMAGEFRYRPEGLLDDTHLRFFTRQSLRRFLADQGWTMDSLETVQRALPESEFRIAFDTLPPAVARHLLALPDALTYQFIIVSRPAPAQPLPAAAPIDTPAVAQAQFTAQLYWDDGQGMDEAHKLVTTGVIGQRQQTLRFQLPAALPGLQGLKLDPADRPGILHLRSICLRSAAEPPRVAWQWSALADGTAALLASARTQQMVCGGALPGDASAAVLLTGDDPWIHLPIAADTLQQAAAAGPLLLEVQLDWPMSADYLSLASVVGPLQAEQQRLREQHAADTGRLTERLSELHQDHERLALENAHLRHDRDALFAAGQSAQQQLAELHQQLHGMAEHVDNLRNLRAVRYTRLLAELVNGVRRPPGRTPAPAGAAPAEADAGAPVPPPLSPTVDIIVPVYRGLRDTQVCIDAVLAGGPRTDWRLIVINDSSPEPEVTAWLRDKAAAEPRITLLENEHNLGFVGTVNRGMRQSEHNDVLLLNSDTEVAGDWLDRLRAAAYRQARAGTVTPFSGNATICSYPVFCADNPLPPGHSTASLDRLFAQVNAGQSVPVPTGVGFCMYIRRDCLQAVGLFDEAHFGKGYGEENDFCQRAIGLGWHNLHALDTYVLHTGGVSFGDSKSPREQAAMETLRRLHPGYDAQVQRFLQLDPARPARLAVDWLRHTDGGRRQVVLVVQHQRGGGTERHILELAATLADTAVLVSLRPAGGQRVQLQLIEQDAGRWAPSRRWAASFDLGHDGDALLRLLRDMAVSHVHYHHLLGHAPRVWTLAHELGVAYDVTCHDFYSFCTHITLTGRHGRYQMDAQGECCGGDHPPSLPETREPIDAWRIRNRRFLQQARFVLTPSLDTAERMRRAMSGATLRCAPHTDILPDTLPMPQPPRLAAQEPLRIVAIGALSVIKGADVLEETARLARRAGAPLEFHLIGYGYRHLQTAPGTALTVHGQYADEDLPALLQRLAPHLAWFPAQWPETYSYTLSAALQAGLPVAVPDLGAFAERVAERPWSWVQAWDSSASQWLELFLRIRQQAFVDGQVQAAPPLSAPLQALRRQLGDWQYASDYLPAAAPAPWPEQLERARRVAAALAQAAPADAAAAPLGADRLYALALRLQRLPLLGRALRAVPRSWRYRVRQLLSR